MNLNSGLNLIFLCVTVIVKLQTLVDRQRHANNQNINRWKVCEVLVLCWVGVSLR